MWFSEFLTRVWHDILLFLAGWEWHRLKDKEQDARNVEQRAKVDKEVRGMSDSAVGEHLRQWERM